MELNFTQKERMPSALLIIDRYICRLKCMIIKQKMQEMLQNSLDI